MGSRPCIDGYITPHTRHDGTVPVRRYHRTHSVAGQATAPTVYCPSPTPRGEAVVIRKAVCIHEEDAGILWKHVSVRQCTTAQAI